MQLFDKNLLRQKQVIAGLLISFIGLVIILAAALWPTSSQSTANSQSNLVDNCISDATFSCYRDELTNLTKEQGPERAFALVKQQYTKLAYVKSQCHQLAHVIGRAAYAKYGDIADTYAHGDQFCWSGFYHGVMEQLSKQEGRDYVIKNANTLCEAIAAKNPHSFYHYNCVHGMGHGFMFILDQDLFASLKACDAVIDEWERSSCYGGSFMQNIMNVQSPDRDADESSKFLKADDPMYPCNAAADKYKQQCYLMQTSYALQLENYDFSKVFALCAQVQGESLQHTCYQSLGRDASGQSVYNADIARQKCLLGPTYTARQYCIYGAVLDFVSNFHNDQQAYQLCKGLPADLQSYCNNTVKNYYATF